MRRQGSGRDDAAKSQERQAPPEAGRAAEGPPPTPQSRRERGPAGTGAAIPSSGLQNRGEMRLLHFLTPCSVLGPVLCILHIIVLRGH